MDASELKDHYDYVIIGAGVAGAAAAQAIRETDPNGSLALIGAEPHGPVYRPDLSKKLWREDDATVDGSHLDMPDGIDVAASATADSLDPNAHQVSVGGTTIGYGKLLIATGGEPRTLDLPDSERVIYFRTVADYERLRRYAAKGSRVAVVGGGFIGSEIVSALAQNGVTVTWIMPEAQVQEAAFPADLAARLTAMVRDKGVDVRTYTTVNGGDATGDQVTLQTDSGDTITADAVVVGAGIAPAVTLAESAGLSTDNGIVVDEFLRTSAPDVYAAGDVAHYLDPLLGSRRVEHVDNAEKMGERAGRTMAGSEEPYAYTPFFWSDIFDAGYEAIGEIRSDLATVEDWNDNHDAGVVYYLGDDDTVRGVLLWNVWDSVDKARTIIADSQAGSLDRDQLVGAIPLG